MTTIPEISGARLTMKPAVADAVRELRDQFGENVQIVELDDGGCRVIVSEMDLAGPFRQATTWMGFTLTPLYPYADIYPHFVRPDLERLNGAPLGAAIHQNNNFYGQPAVMISRRTRLMGAANPNNALLKLLKVQSWLRSQ